MEAEQKTSGREASASAESAGPNPEAIAWYVDEAQRLLEDQQRRAESLRTRGGQVAGFGAAVLALIGGNSTALLEPLSGLPRIVVGVALVAATLSLATAVGVAIWGALRPRVFAMSTEEITRLTSDRFLSEPELWRVHLRALRALGEATTSAQAAGDSAEVAIEKAFRAFLAGLVVSSLGIVTLLVELI